MVQQMKKYAEISHMSLLCLYKQIYRSALLNQKNLGRVGKNGKKLVLKLVYAQENRTLLVKTRYCLLLILDNFFHSSCLYDISKSIWY
jgi:hypothetical protein